MINITIDKNGKSSPNTIDIGNQWENRDEELVFSFPEEFKDFNKYVIAYIKNRKTKKEIRQIFPITNDTFVVSSGVTRYAGSWHLYTLCKESPLDLDSDTVDIRAKNGERISISDSINANISPNDIGDDAFENFPMDENIKLIYDELFALKLEFEKDETAREENELARKHEEELRVQAENARVQEEANRVNAENARTEAEGVRVQSETNRVSAEQLRVDAENERTNAETERKQAEVARGAEENKRAEAEVARGTEENKRAEAETARQSAETNRVNAENERVSAETLRKQFEDARQENEESRQSAETNRVNAENLRVSAEHAREQAEQSRISTESQRVTAEATRENAEHAREQAEQSRISAESQRVTAEATRENAEHARVEAENARENAEQLRVNAENLRVEAENRRDSVINDLRNSVDQKITKFYASNQGEAHITDSDNGKIQDMLIYGKSSQDGTPSIENPIDIKSVVNPTIKLTGANLWRGDYSDHYWMGGGTVINDGCISSDYIYVKGAQKIYMGLSYDWWIGFYCYDENKNKILKAYILNSTETNKEIDYRIVSSDEIPKNACYIMAMYHKKEKKPYVSIVKDTYKPYTEQTITLPITLNAVPVSSGGNVTINGQQYISDYVDVERGKVVRMINTVHPKEAEDMTEWTGVKEIAVNFRATANGAVKHGAVLSNMLINTRIWGDDGTIGTYIATNDKIDFTLPYKLLGIDQSATHEQRNTVVNAWLKNNDLMFTYILNTPIEEDLTAEQVQKLKALKTYYPTTNISTNSEQLEGYTVFNYPISMANGWNYVKQQLNDNRDYIYDMDLQSAEAYVNSEYAVALTELGV